MLHPHYYQTGTRIEHFTPTVNTRLRADVGAYALPHPFKTASGVAHHRRQYGADELNNDLSLCEDSHFTLTLKEISETAASGKKEITYMCVADGVGSWRQWGVDPRNFSSTLVSNSKRAIEFDADHRALTPGGKLFCSIPVCGSNPNPLHVVKHSCY